MFTLTARSTAARAAVTVPGACDLLHEARPLRAHAAGLWDRAAFSAGARAVKAVRPLSLDIPASSASTHQRPGWSPRGPGMIADLKKLDDGASAHAQARHLATPSH
jgi:hypothetical protein